MFFPAVFYNLIMDLNKVTPFSKILAIVIFLTLPFLGFYLGTKSQVSLSGETSQSEALTDSTDQNVLVQEKIVAQAPRITQVAKTKSSTSQNLTYSQAVNLYNNRRIQFDANCTVTPSSIVVKNGTAMMFDNRWSLPRSIALDGVRYVLDGYGFKVITLSNPNLPHTTRIDCGTGVNNARIILE